MGRGGRMACCSAPPTSPNARASAKTRQSARGGGMAAALAERRRQAGLPPLDMANSPRSAAMPQPPTSLAMGEFEPQQPQQPAPYQVPVNRGLEKRTRSPRPPATIQRVRLAEAEGMVASVSARPDGSGVFMSEPRLTRHGELTHWCQLYRDGSYRQGCLLGGTAHEQLGPVQHGETKFVVGSTVGVEAGQRVRAVDLSLQSWKVSETALERRAPGGKVEVRPADWLQGMALVATLRCSSSEDEPASITIEDWETAMASTVPQPEPDELAGLPSPRGAGQAGAVSWWNAAECHTRMVFRPEAAPPPPPTTMETPVAPETWVPRNGRALFADPPTTARRRMASAAVDSPGRSSRRGAMWQQQKPLLEVLARLTGANGSDYDRRDALRDLNELITLDPEAQRVFVERCTEDPALELAIRNVLPSAGTVDASGTAVLQSDDMVHDIRTLSSGELQGDAFTTARRAQTSRLSDLT